MIKQNLEEFRPLLSIVASTKDRFPCRLEIVPGRRIQIHVNDWSDIFTPTEAEGFFRAIKYLLDSGRL